MADRGKSAMMYHLPNIDTLVVAQQPSCASSKKVISEVERQGDPPFSFDVSNLITSDLGLRAISTFLVGVVWKYTFRYKYSGFGSCSK
jgi:hypothetical protein